MKAEKKHEIHFNEITLCFANTLAVHLTTYKILEIIDKPSKLHNLYVLELLFSCLWPCRWQILLFSSFLTLELPPSGNQFSATHKIGLNLEPSDCMYIFFQILEIHGWVASALHVFKPTCFKYMQMAHSLWQQFTQERPQTLNPYKANGSLLALLAFKANI